MYLYDTLLKNMAHFLDFLVNTNCFIGPLPSWDMVFTLFGADNGL